MFVVLCNAPREQADALASGAIEQELAACVNLVDVRSVYRWKGEVVSEPETTLFFKVSEERVLELQRWLVQAHPYDLPEVVALPVSEAHSFAPYVSWVRSAGKASEAPQ